MRRNASYHELMKMTEKAKPECFVLDMLACEEKPYSIFLFGNEGNDGKCSPSDVSVEAVERRLKSQGVSNPIVTKFQKEDSDYFVFFDPDADFDMDRLLLYSLCTYI